jgi:hypothetical protein
MIGWFTASKLRPNLPRHGDDQTVNVQERSALDRPLLFNRLDRWIVRRIWSHRFKHWRCAGWKVLPAAKLYREFGLVNLVGLILETSVEG